MRLPANRGPLLAALLALLAALTLTIVVVVDTDDNGKPRRTITIRVDAADADRTADDRLVVPTAAIAPAAASEAGDHQGAKSETPVGVAPTDIEEARDQQDRLAANDQLPVVSPNAAPQQGGCRSRFVASHSSRRGVAPRLFVLHYTVSPNRPGWSDVDGVTALFARASFAASSHYVIDREGHCNYIVRESDKAWTQATFNPVAISVEIINSGREGSLISGAGSKRLARVLADATRRWKIPLRVGAVKGCTVTRSGVVTHQMLGPCGGGHVDVSPYGWTTVLADAKGLRGGVVTASDRVTCRKLNSWRKAGRPKGGRWERNSVRRRLALARRGVTCTAKGPVRR